MQCCWKYVPKRNHFRRQHYQARVALAAMDHNFNVGWEEEPEKSKVEWRKATKRWVRRRVFEKKSYKWRNAIFLEIVHARMKRERRDSSFAPSHFPTISPPSLDHLTFNFGINLTVLIINQKICSTALSNIHFYNEMLNVILISQELFRYG